MMEEQEMFNKDKTEKQLLYGEIERLRKVNRKLADENRRLREGLVNIERYREKYTELIQSAEKIQKRYRAELKAFDGIGDLYKKELGKLKK